MYEVALYTRSVAVSHHVLRVFALLPVQRARCSRARTGTFFEASAIWPLSFDGKKWAFISREQFIVDHVWLSVLSKIL